jgi:hypothetical protein
VRSLLPLRAASLAPPVVILGLPILQSIIGRRKVSLKAFLKSQRMR